LRALHKKTNLKFTQQQEEKRGVRATGIEERRKYIRSQLNMNNRPNVLDAVDSKMDEFTSLSSNNSTQKSSTPQESSSNSLNASKQSAAQARADAENRRREKLLKWQKEKAAMNKAAGKSTSAKPKPPFKVLNKLSYHQPGISLTLATLLLQLWVFALFFKVGPTIAPIPMKKPANSTRMLPGNAKAKATGKPVEKPKAPGDKAAPSIPERRVTRAMSQNPGSKAPDAIIRPAISKMKNLAISNQNNGGKVAATTTSRTLKSKQLASSNNTSKAPLKSNASSDPKKNLVKGTGKGTLKKAAGKPVHVENSDNSVSPTSMEVKENVPAPVAVKKLKPKAIDATYIEYK